MNKRQVIVLWVIALALTAALVAVNSSKSDAYQSTTERGRGDTLLADFKPAEVAAISITRGAESLKMARKDDQWVVTDRDNYPADVNDINELLRTLEEVKVTQGIEAEPESAPRFGMDPEAAEDAEKGVELVLSNDAGSELAKLTFGKNTESAGSSANPFGGGATGRFVRNHADTSGIYLTSELFPTLTTQASSWLDDDFLKVEKIRSIQVGKPGRENEVDWKLVRGDEDGEFALEGKLDNEELDTAAINPLKSLFSYARFEDVVTADKAEDSWDKEQRRQAVIETFEGFTYHLTFGPEKTEGEAAAQNHLLRVSVTAELPEKRKPAENETEEQAKQADDAFASRKKELEESLAVAKRLEGRTFRVTSYTVDPLLKNRTGLIKSAPPAGAPDGAGAPAGAAVMPPVARPATAVTPPIAIPPLPDEGGEPPAGDSE